MDTIYVQAEARAPGFAMTMSQPCVDVTDRVLSGTMWVSVKTCTARVLSLQIMVDAVPAKVTVT